VHLAGKTDARDVGTAQASIAECLSDRQTGGAPPVSGILLSPSDLRRSESGVFFRCRAQNPPAVVYDDSSRPAGPDIDAE
jgi:hypothetical protein